MSEWNYNIKSYWDQTDNVCLVNHQASAFLQKCSLSLSTDLTTVKSICPVCLEANKEEKLHYYYKWITFYFTDFTPACVKTKCLPKSDFKKIASHDFTHVCIGSLHVWWSRCIVGNVGASWRTCGIKKNTISGSAASMSFSFFFLFFKTVRHESVTVIVFTCFISGVLYTDPPPTHSLTSCSATQETRISAEMWIWRSRLSKCIFAPLPLACALLQIMHLHSCVWLPHVGVLLWPWSH